MTIAGGRPPHLPAGARPADAYAESSGFTVPATRVVGRIARGHVLSDAVIPADVELTPLEQRVMAAYGG